MSADTEEAGTRSSAPDRERKRVRIRWTGEGEVFEGGPVGGSAATMDGDGEEGPGPMDTLLGALAGCMAIDVRMILEKSRVAVDDIVVEAEGVRASEPPRRYEEITLSFRVAGPTEADAAKLERAIDLSRNRYCSVLHSLREDIDVRITVERA